MAQFSCPKCGLGLEDRERCFVCAAGHSYDKAKSGYVNLLLPGKGAGQHGDDREMVRARRDFLDRGFYSALASRVSAIAASLCPDGGVVLDSGCGECYYTALAAEAIRSAGKNAEVFGIDVSKDAVNAGAKRDRSLRLAAASAYRLPFPDGSADLILDLFAPFAEEEFARVLKPGGTVIKAAPLPMHLMELKQAVYDEVYPTKPEPMCYAGFSLVSEEEVKTCAHLPDGQTVRDLFAMTPYAHKTSETDKRKLDLLDCLDVRFEFGIHLYRRDGE